MSVIDKLLPYRGLPRPVYVLFVARIINRLGDFVRFFLALYLTRVLALPKKQAGLVVAAAALATLLGGLAGGRLADRMGRKKIIVTAHSLSAALLIICGFLPSASWLPVPLILSQFFFGVVRPAGQALATDLTSLADRRKTFSLLYLGINIGVALGPMIAGFLFENHRQWIFWGDAATTLVGTALVALMVPEPRKDQVQRGGRGEDVDEAGSLRAFLGRPILAIFLLVNIVAHFIYAQVNFSLPLLMSDFFGDGGARNFGLLMSVNAVTVLIFTPIFLMIMGKSRPAGNMVWAAAAYALGFGSLALIPGTMGWMLFSTVVWTWGEILFALNVRVFSAAYTPLNHRARFASIEQIGRGMGAFLSPGAAGFLTASLGLRGLWGLIFVLSLTVMAAMAVLHRLDKRKGTVYG